MLLEEGWGGSASVGGPCRGCCLSLLVSHGCLGTSRPGAEVVGGTLAPLMPHTKALLSGLVPPEHLVASSRVAAALGGSWWEGGDSWSTQWVHGWGERGPLGGHAMLWRAPNSPNHNLAE